MADGKESLVANRTLPPLFEGRWGLHNLPIHSMPDALAGLGEKEYDRGINRTRNPVFKFKRGVEMWKRSWILLAVFALVAAACGGDGATGTTSAPDAGSSTQEGSVTTATESGAVSDDGAVSQASSADTPATGYRLTSTGDLTFEHTGDNYCSIYQGRFEIDFLQFDDVFISYSGMVDGFDGAGEYQGTFTLISDDPVIGVESAGSLSISAQIGEGDINPVLFGEVSGSFEGDAGSGSFKGVYSCQVLATELFPETADSGDTSNRIEYTVTGDASASIAETGVVLCSRGSDTILHSVGVWVISVDAPGATPGTLTASFMVSAPSQVEEVRSDDPFADRFEGAGSFTYSDSGGLFSGTFSAPGLTSESGFTIDLEGTFSCEAF